MAKRSWMNDDDNATAGAIRSMLRKMPADVRAAVLADVDRNADFGARVAINDIVRAEEIVTGRRFK